MSAMKIFAAITGLRPFSLIRSSCAILIYVAVLVIAKLVNAYLFCGFNNNFFFDLPLAIPVFVSNCFIPLLGLATNATPTTTACGRCCRTFSIVLILMWQISNVFVILLNGCKFFIAIFDSNLYSQSKHDPFGIFCGNRTNDIVLIQFRNATATYDIFQRIDLVYKTVVLLGWLLLIPFVMAACFIFMDSVFPKVSKDPKPANSENEVGETIVSMSESGEESTEQSSVGAEDGSTDIEDESAQDDAARETEERKPEVGSVDVRMKNLSNEISEPGSNAEPQSNEAKEPEFSIVDEEEEATTTKSANEDSN